jgi:hypothetical protein
VFQELVGRTRFFDDALEGLVLQPERFLDTTRLEAQKVEDHLQPRHRRIITEMRGIRVRPVQEGGEEEGETAVHLTLPGWEELQEAFALAALVRIIERSQPGRVNWEREVSNLDAACQQIMRRAVQAPTFLGQSVRGQVNVEERAGGILVRLGEGDDEEVTVERVRMSLQQLGGERAEQMHRRWWNDQLCRVHIGRAEREDFRWSVRTL